MSNQAYGYLLDALNGFPPDEEYEDTLVEGNGSSGEEQRQGQEQEQEEEVEQEQEAEATDGRNKRSSISLSEMSLEDNLRRRYYPLYSNHPTFTVFELAYVPEECEGVHLKYFDLLENGRQEITVKKVLNEIREYEHFIRIGEHPNVCQYLGVIVENVHNEDYICGLALKQYPYTLTRYLSLFPNCDREQLASGIKEGLKYLHDNNTTHGRLEAKSIMVDTNGQPVIISLGYSLIEFYDPSYYGFERLTFSNRVESDLQMFNDLCSYLGVEPDN